jgi:hypothetical protein
MSKAPGESMSKAPGEMSKARGNQPVMPRMLG